MMKFLHRTPRVNRTRSRSFWSASWRRLRRDRAGMTGLVVIVLLILVAYFAPLIANEKPIVMQWQGKTYYPALADMAPFRWFVDYRELRTFDFQRHRSDATVGIVLPFNEFGPRENRLDERLSPPTFRHPMGTDPNGRDVFSRVVHGTAVALKIGIVAMGIALIIGLFMGALAGYYGGWIDIVISRAIEVVICFPFLFLVLAVIAFLPPSTYNVMVIIGLTRWTSIARYTRAEFIRVKEEEFTDAARALGVGDIRIIVRHILPNALAPVLVAVSFGVASAILIEAALSFLGLGAQPPTPTWGEILRWGRDNIEIAWWLAVFPGLAIFVTVTAYNLLGEGLRDATDPRAPTQL